MSPRRHIAALILLVILTLLAYWPTLSAGFVWADDTTITANPMLRDTGGGGLTQIWTWGPQQALARNSPGYSLPLPSDPPRRYLPITYTSYWLDYHLWQDQPQHYHEASLFLHLTATLLLYTLLTRLGLPFAAALLASLLYALHPVNVESVAWISQRSNLLALIFSLLTALCWTRWAGIGIALTPAKTLARLLLLTAACLFYLAALLSHPLAITLPPILLLIAWCTKPGLNRRTFLSTIPFFLFAALSALLTLHLESLWLDPKSLDWQIAPISRLLIAAQAIPFYLQKLLLPFNLTFNYPHWNLFPNPTLWLILPAILAIAFILFILQKPLTRLPAACLLIFLIALLPALGFASFYFQRYAFVADHYQYFAAIPLFTLAATAFAALTKRLPAPFTTVIAALLIAPLLWLTWTQARIYQNNETLCRDALAKNPTAWLPALELGTDLYHTGTAPALSEAQTLLQSTLEAHPDRPAIARTLASVQLAQGHMKDAQETLLKNLKLNPDDPGNNELLADMIIKSLGETAYPTAVRHYETALRQDPSRASAAKSLADIYLAQGKPADARRILETTLRNNSRNGSLQSTLAGILMQQRDYPAANAAFEQATLLQPENAELYFNSGLTLLELNRPAEAEGRFRQALTRFTNRLRETVKVSSPENSRRREEIEHQLALCHLGLGRALLRQGKTHAAMGEFESAIANDDTLLAAYYEAGVAIAPTHEADAERFFRQGLRKDSNYYPIQVALARLLAGSQDPERHNILEAIVLLRRASEATHGSNLLILVGMADLLAQADFTQEAADAYERALTLTGDQAPEPIELELILQRLHACYIRLAPPLPIGDHPRPLIPTDNTMEMVPQDFRSLRFIPFDVTDPPAAKRDSATKPGHTP